MVIDTSLFIEYLRARDKTLSALYHLPEESALFVTTVTVYELHVGATTETKRQDVERALNGCAVLDFTQAAAVRAATIMNELKRTGQTIAAPDIFIAAVALVHNQSIKTLNRKDFERIEGLILV